ncbi:MAG TPA: trehalose-phosphatase [Moorella mulderi]|nr:trehalose-phosphatase [Moorella mulderi]
MLRKISPKQLAAEIAQKLPCLLMCDYDGTLVPLAPRPELALPTPRLLNLLKLLAQKPALKIAVISGRPVAQLGKLLPVPGIHLAGLHGMEISLSNGKTINFLPPKTDEIEWKKIEAVLHKLAQKATGFWVEDKGKAVALHYRQADPRAAAEIKMELFKTLTPYLGDTWEILEGNKVWEIRPKGINKGTAARYFLQLWPEYYPVYLGDDTTDEDAFEALAEKGLTVKIGVGPTKAARFLPSAPEVERLLQLLVSSIP